MVEAFDWVKPSPLWQLESQDFRQAGFFRPQLLEFRSDAFMDEFFAVAGAAKPDGLGAVITPQPGATTPVKLYQPVHGCFYLACASLCCRMPGFPDREVRVADGESVFFVLRKLTEGEEFAWVIDGPSKGWQPLNGQPRRSVRNEERLPLLEAQSGCCRSLLFGYIPVSSRETYAVPASSLKTENEDGDISAPDTRVEEFGSRFNDPLKALDAMKTDGSPGSVSPAVVLSISVAMILDLWEYFDRYLPDVAAALAAGTSGPFTDKADEKTALIKALADQQLGTGVTLASALTLAASKRDELNAPGGGNLPALGFTDAHSLKGRKIETKRLSDAIRAALPETLPDVELPKLESGQDVQYTLRCVYERPQCDPPVQVVSQPSVPFQLAPFFDADAPVRPVRIALPADVSVAGLRKFKQGVTFIMSDAMRKKVDMLTGNERKLIEDPPEVGPESGGAFAFVCSFSIQIIFIVAFFLLLMFVIILNFVFWWIAFFKICFPIPKRFLPE
jgi:hypothetical protein